MKLNAQKLINDGWKLFEMDPPSTNSFEYIMVILKPIDGYFSRHYGFFQAVWEPQDNYTVGKIYQRIKLDGSANPIWGQDITNKVLFWKPLYELIERYEEKDNG